MTSYDGSETVPVRIKGWDSRNKIYPMKWNIGRGVMERHYMERRMNDKWDNVDSELDRYTTKKSRVCAKYEYSLIANDKLRRSDKAEVGIWNDAKGEKVQIKHPCQEEIDRDAWWYACSQVSVGYDDFFFRIMYLLNVGC